MVFLRNLNPARHEDCIVSACIDLATNYFTGGVPLKKITAKEMTWIYNQRLQEAAEKRMHEEEELRRFAGRFTLLLILSLAVLVLLLMTFSPGTVQNAAGPAIQKVAAGASAVKPVMKGFGESLQSAAPSIANWIGSAGALLSH